MVCSLLYWGCIYCCVVLQGNQGFPCDPFLLRGKSCGVNLMVNLGFPKYLAQGFIARKGRAGKPWFPCEEGAEEYCEGGLFVEEWVGEVF